MLGIGIHPLHSRNLSLFELTLAGSVVRNNNIERLTFLLLIPFVWI